MKVVFRFEDHDTGVGVYNCGFPWETVIGQDSWQHPTYHDDAKLKNSFNDSKFSPFFDDYYFGFSTEDQMHKWFHNCYWLQQMDLYGIVLRTYKVEEIYLHEGTSQCLFYRDKAELVETFNILDYFGIK